MAQDLSSDKQAGVAVTIFGPAVSSYFCCSAAAAYLMLVFIVSYDFCHPFHVDIIIRVITDVQILITYGTDDVPSVQYIPSTIFMVAVVVVDDDNFPIQIWCEDKWRCKETYSIARKWLHKEVS